MLRRFQSKNFFNDARREAGKREHRGPTLSNSEVWPITSRYTNKLFHHVNAGYPWKHSCKDVKPGTSGRHLYNAGATLRENKLHMHGGHIDLHGGYCLFRHVTYRCSYISVHVTGKYDLGVQEMRWSGTHFV